MSPKKRQEKFPVPPDEADRLSALCDLQILDTNTEPEFDRIVHLARVLFGMRMAGISFVGYDHQWFKAISGSTCEGSSREHAICAHTILSDDALIVPDTAQDKRFKNNQFVIESPFIRFYVGIPLNTRNGSKVGALCLLDTKPHFDWSPLRTSLLKEMAALVCSALENRVRGQKEQYYKALIRQLQLKMKVLPANE